MAHLRYRDSDGKPAVLTLSGGEVVIGRLPGCDVVISKNFVSRRHARVHHSGGRWTITDLDSSHGTFVNRLRVKEKVLEPNDQIEIGGEVLTYSDDALIGRPAPKKIPAMPIQAAEEEVATGEYVPPSTDPAIMSEQKLGSGALMRMTMVGSVADFASLRPATAKTTKTDDLLRSVQEKERLETLLAVSKELHRGATLEAVVRTTVETALKVFQADRGVLALAPEPGQPIAPALQLTSAKGGFAETTVRVSQTLVDRAIHDRKAVAVLDTGQDASVAMARSIVAQDIRSVLCAPVWDGEEILGYLYLDSVGIGRRFGPDDLDLLSVIGYTAAGAIGRLKAAERIKQEENRRNNLARFVSADVVRHLDEQASTGSLDPTALIAERELTVLFSDIVGFTTLSEGLSPTQLKKFLDEYFERMIEIIMDRNGGTLDKYIGDAIMALFGAPYSRGIAEDARSAVNAALEMCAAIQQLRRGGPEMASLDVRIGINTGKAVAGPLGAQRRLEYSAIGDAVNVASRLESTGSPGCIQIGESTYDAVKDYFVCEYAGEHPVKNRKQPVKSWWVVEAKS